MEKIENKRKFYNFFFIEPKNLFLFNWIFTISCFVVGFIFYMIGFMISTTNLAWTETIVLLSIYVGIISLPSIFISINNLFWFNHISKDYRAMLLSSPILNILLFIINLIIFIFGMFDDVIFMISIIFAIAVFIGQLYLIYTNSFLWRKIKNDKENILR